MFLITGGLAWFGFGFKGSAVQLGRPDEDWQMFVESHLCSGAFGGVAVPGWGGYHLV